MISKIYVFFQVCRDHALNFRTFLQWALGCLYCQSPGTPVVVLAGGGDVKFVAAVGAWLGMRLSGLPCVTATRVEFLNTFVIGQ